MAHEIIKAIELPSGPTIDEFIPIIEDTVARIVATIEQPKDGKDGVGLAGSFIDRTGSLILTMTDGSTRDLGVIVGRDGFWNWREDNISLKK